MGNGLTETRKRPTIDNAGAMKSDCSFTNRSKLLFEIKEKGKAIGVEKVIFGN